MTVFAKYHWLSLFLLLLISGCSSTPPRHTEDLCQLFAEKDDWYPAAKKAERRWQIPISVQMAIMYQESRFKEDAEPPRPLILGFIPWFKNSSAYGYPQAQDFTWSDYQKSSGHWLASREDFEDSCDFIGWYCAISQKKLGLAADDGYNLYLSYHEGHGGFRQQSQNQKPWLLVTAQKVQNRAKRYQQQLTGCKKQLEDQN